MLNPFSKNNKSADGQENKNWYKDRYQYVLVWRNILAVITLVALGVALVAILSVHQLAPLKSVEPFVIQVDEKTGIPQVVDPLQVENLAANEALNNFFLVQYVRARESYDPTDLQTNYNIVRVMSEPEKVYPEFRWQVSPSNPDSPYNRLKTEGTRAVKFRSIAYLPNKVTTTKAGSTISMVAQVRITIEERAGTKAPVRYERIALVTFEYAKINLNAEERYINPLGFIVTSYRTDEEILQQ